MGHRRARKRRDGGGFGDDANVSGRGGVQGGAEGGETASEATGCSRVDSGIRSMRERIKRIAAAESTTSEIPAGEWCSVCAAGEELLSGDGGGGDVLVDPSSGRRKWVLGDWESDATRIPAGVRQGGVEAGLLKAGLRPSLNLRSSFGSFFTTRLDSTH